VNQAYADKFPILLCPKSDTEIKKTKMIGLTGTKSKPELTYIIHSKYVNRVYIMEASNAFISIRELFRVCQYR
jgi:hypothetical protein